MTAASTTSGSCTVASGRESKHGSCRRLVKPTRVARGASRKFATQPERCAFASLHTSSFAFAVFKRLLLVWAKVAGSYWCFLTGDSQSPMPAETSRCQWLVFVILFETLLFPAPLYSQRILEEQALAALAIAPSLQEIYSVINITKHDNRVTWESMEITDFSCRPGYFIGLRYSDPPVDEAFVPSRSSTPMVVKFSRVPPAFDSRQTWPDRVGESANQGPCGLCWAVAWAGVLSDRFAIGYQGNYSIGELSPGDLQACAQRSPTCASSPSQIQISKYLLNVGVGKLSCFKFNGTLGNYCLSQCHSGETPIRCGIVESVPGAYSHMLQIQSGKRNSCGH